MSSTTPGIEFRPAIAQDFDYCAKLYFAAMEATVRALNLDVDSADMRLIPDVLPVGRLKARSLAWLERAFVAGAATGHVEVRGPTRKFPFHGEGEFAATAQVRGVTLDYFPGLAPLTDGAGTVRFVNSWLEGELRSGKMADLAIGHANFSIADLKDVVVDVAADAHGDVASALGYLQRGPLAANLGTLFNQVSGSGPADYTVNLSLPLADPAARDYRVRTQFTPRR